MTVTVTSFPSTCSATTIQPATSLEASESASTPVVVVPGTQSMTATYNVPAGGGQHNTTSHAFGNRLLTSYLATITPGASAMSSMESAAVSIPASSNTTSGALSSVPMASYSILPLTPITNPTTAAPQSSTTTATKSGPMTETTTSQISTTSPSSSSTNAPVSSNDATKSFNGMTIVIVGALAGGVAFLL